MRRLPSFAASTTLPLRGAAPCVDACAKRTYSVRRRTSRAAPRMVAAGGDAKRQAVPLAPQASDVWELDFYSRPVVGMDGKKLWELIITDSLGSFEHVEAIPNSLVNSTALRARIQAVIADAPTPPTTVRFFRTQMRNMITIALEGVGVQVRPSRRTYALQQLIRHRESAVYPAMPGYRKPIAIPTPNMPGMPSAAAQGLLTLPDPLRCDSFAFAKQPLALLESFFEESNPSDFFGERCLVGATAGEALVPGLVLYSSRATSVAGWMSGIELAAVAVREDSIVMECGIDTRYRFGEVDGRIRDEAKAFEAAKGDVDGLHFLAVMKSAEDDEVDGMWLLCDTL